MAIESNLNLAHALTFSSNLQTAPLTDADAATLLDSNILIAGAGSSDIAYLQTILEISGFANISTVYSGTAILNTLRLNIHNGSCNIDLILFDGSIDDISTHQLRGVMDQFDEWRLIPIISLTQESQWDHSQALTDLGYGVTSLHYHPLTAEALPPAIMTALAVKKERDEAAIQRMALEEELSKLKIMEARLQFSVEHDELTGLGNRRKLEHELELLLIQARNFGTHSAMLYIDLDRFKVLNDTEGHVAGDALLVQMANSLRKFFSPNDTLVRIGSDEFAVLMTHTSASQAMIKAEEVRANFDGYSFEHLGIEYHLSVSIGVKAIGADNELVVGDILSNANQACYTAKKRGRNRVHLYSPDDMEMQILRHNVQWAPKIRTALEQQNFILEYQPIYSVKNSRISHYECLIRMQGEKGAVYDPNEFIPVAESMGLVEQIDLWVINHVFDLIPTLPTDISLNVNLSGNIFLESQLYALLEKKISETNVNPRRIVFEITETSAISNFEQTKEMVGKIRSLGCRFALDDFGAGFNSYNYIKHLPVDILKIDGTFITDLETESVDQLLVKSMIDIAHQLGKKTVAEFVETQGTMDLLKELGIDYIQGFLVGKPQATL